MLDVRRMKVLREVAARGSFSGAAEALSFTQSAISQQVAALERETGATLLERGPRGVRLTDAGAALVSHADAILARLDDAEEELAALAGLRGGRLRLATFQSGGATLVPRAVKAFHDRHPAVELSMVEAEPDEAQSLLRAGAVDLAVLYDYEPIPDSIGADFELAHLIDDAYEAVIAEDHPLARKRGLSLEDLSGDPWIASTSRCGCRAITIRACRDAGFEPRVAFEADETMAAQAFVAAGVGVTMLPKLALSPLRAGVVSRSLGGKAPVRRIWAARPAEGYRSPASDAMVQVLQDAAGEFRAEPGVAAAGPELAAAS